MAAWSPQSIWIPEGRIQWGQREILFTGAQCQCQLQYKLEDRMSYLNNRKYFTLQLMKHCHKSPREGSSWKSLKRHLVMGLGNLLWVALLRSSLRTSAIQWFLPWFNQSLTGGMDWFTEVEIGLEITQKFWNETAQCSAVYLRRHIFWLEIVPRGMRVGS